MIQGNIMNLHIHINSEWVSEWLVVLHLSEDTDVCLRVVPQMEQPIIIIRHTETSTTSQSVSIYICFVLVWFGLEELNSLERKKERSGLREDILHDGYLRQRARYPYNGSQGKPRPSSIERQPYEFSPRKQYIRFDVVWHSRFIHFSTQFNETC